MSRLLIIENHHAGDAVLALPFLRGARRVFSDIAVCCTPAGAEIFRAAGVENLIVMGGGDSIFATIGKLRAFKPDVAAAVWADSRLHVLMRLSGARIRAGLPMNETNFYGAHLPWRKKRLGQGRLLENVARPFIGRLLTNATNRSNPLQAHLEDWRQLAALVGIECDFAAPWIPVKSAGLDSKLLETIAAAKTAGKITLAIHHGGRLATKRWPADRFENVAQKCAARGDVQLVAIQAPEVDPLKLPAGALAVATPTIPALIELLAVSDILLCNDSLAAHLAAALGKKVVSIFGPGHPSWFAPVGSEAWAVKDDECMYNPCLDRCLMGRTICLENISEGSVMTSVGRCITSFKSR